MSNEHIFVYGTLRKETANPAYQVIAQYCKFLSEGFLQGRLYEIAGYPGAVESDDPNEKVKGEIYKINNKNLVLARLDDYEECSESFPHPHEYKRKRLLVTLSNGEKTTAWGYMYNRNIEHLVHITSGDYLRFKNEEL